MSLIKFGGRVERDAFSNVYGPLIPPRYAQARTGSVAVNNTTAMRHSALWACLALRAGLISTFPVDVFRDVGDTRVQMPKPPILKAPGGESWDWIDWSYASQVDVDRAGNTIGLITEVNAMNLPARIDLQDISSCTVRVIGKDSYTGKKPGSLEYRIHGKIYDADQVWHERQYLIPGLEVGLSPIAFAAWSIGEYLSMQEFALSWFGGAGVPKARLKNVTQPKVDPKEAGIIRDRWRATVADGDLFVHGKDWEFDLIGATSAGLEWIEGRRFGLSEISRFFQCPADLIDAAISAPGTITYQSMSQRNLQFLIMQLGPAIIRRQTKWSKLLPAPRYVKLNTDALLQLDPETRGRVMNAAIAGRRLTVTEARALDNRAPLTQAERDEFRELFGDPTAKPPSNPAPKLPPAALSDDELGLLERAYAHDDQALRVQATVGHPAMIGGTPWQP